MQVIERSYRKKGVNSNETSWLWFLHLPNQRGGRWEGWGVHGQYAGRWRSGQTGCQDHLAVTSTNPLQAGVRHSQWGAHSEVHSPWGRAIQSGHQLRWKPFTRKSVLCGGRHAARPFEGESLSRHFPSFWPSSSLSDWYIHSVKSFSSCMSTKQTDVVGNCPSWSGLVWLLSCDTVVVLTETCHPEVIDNI